VLLAVTFEACHYDPSQSESEESNPLPLEGEGKGGGETHCLPPDINPAKRGFDFGRPYDIMLGDGGQDEIL
jgi:hypothetical protein